MSLRIQQYRSIKYAVPPFKPRIAVVLFGDHADRFGSDAASSRFGRYQFFIHPGRAECAGVVRGDGQGGGTRLHRGETDERRRVFRAGTSGLTSVQGIFQQISEKHAQFRLRDDRVIGQLNVDVKLDSGAFRLICIEGKNGVERIIAAVYAVRMSRMLFFVVCEV